MEVTGILKLVKETKQVSEKFQNRKFVVTTLEQYPQVIELELQGNKVDIIDAYNVGQEIVCDINLRGRMWINPQGEEQYFNSIVCWKIQPSNAPVGGNQNTAQTKTNTQEFGNPLPSEEPQDMPF